MNRSPMIERLDVTNNDVVINKIVSILKSIVTSVFIVGVLIASAWQW